MSTEVSTVHHPLRWLRRAVAMALAVLVPVSSAHAVPPPDFIFNIGAQLAQTFSVVFICLSAVCSAGFQQISLALHGKTKLALAVAAVLVVLVSCIITFGIEFAWR